ncbi:MAG: MoaD/ThiS family protein [Bacillota bacterium]
MRVKVTLHGHLQELLIGNSAANRTAGATRDSFVTLAEASTVEDLLFYLGIHKNHVGFVALNGAMTVGDACLQNGDEVSIFPVLAGG